MNLRALPIPENVVSLLEGQGYIELYPPQEDCVKAGLFDGKNLLLTTPTASGKTLVAMLAAGKMVLENRGKVVYLTPLRALANEKFEEFKKLEELQKVNGDKVRVRISTGDYDSSGESLGNGDIVVLTNERFDSILRHQVSWLDSVKLYVADEVHLIGESHRGPTLEMILARILSLAEDAQILALSATITNSKDLAAWLGAKLINNSWRPVKLNEGIYRYNEIRFADGSTRKVLSTGRSVPIDVAVDILKDGGQSLIFAETRRRAVSLAQKAAEVLPNLLTPQEQNAARKLAGEIAEAGEETELSRRLAQIVSKGVAFHHAGLAGEHRVLVENGFRDRILKVLTATPTLAAGVNLPARRVVLSSLYRYDADAGGQAPISVLDYKQMCGRAGRPKYDDVGETVLIANSDVEAEEIFWTYVKGRPEPIHSQLSNIPPLRTHLLAAIASLPGVNMDDLHEIFFKTLFAAQYRKATVSQRIGSALDYLLIEKLAEKRGERFVATEFGKRVSMLYIDPATGVLFRRAIMKAERGGTHTAGLLHLVASSLDFTPQLSLRSKDWDNANIFAEEHRAEFLYPVPQDDFESHERFFGPFRTLQVLYAWINEWSEDKVLEQYDVEPGDLHRAVDSAEWLCYSFAELAKLMGRLDLYSESSELRLRVESGIKAELLPLIRLEGVGRVRARVLYRAGYTKISTLAKTPVESIARVPKIGAKVAAKIKQQLESL